MITQIVKYAHLNLHNKVVSVSDISSVQDFFLYGKICSSYESPWVQFVPQERVMM